MVLVVENLRSPEALEPVLNALGGRHIGYGVIPKYYDPVGKALLMSFEQYLQQDWTPEVKRAWTDAYRAITALMLKGAGVESSPNVVRDEKEVTIKNTSATQTQLINEVKTGTSRLKKLKMPLLLMSGNILASKRYLMTSLYW